MANFNPVAFIYQMSEMKLLLLLLFPNSHLQTQKISFSFNSAKFPTRMAGVSSSIWCNAICPETCMIKAT